MPMSETLRRLRARARSVGRRSRSCTGPRCTTGGSVAVKIIRPGIEHQVATDLDLMQPLFEVLARQTGDQMAGSVLQLVDSFRDPDRRGDGPAQRGADDGPLPPAPDRGRPAPDRGPRALPGAVGAERAHDGAARRRPDRRPRPKVGELGRRPGPARRGGGPVLLPPPRADGHLPRRRPRRQHAPAPRRPDRHRRLGDRRTPRPRHPSLRPPAAGGRARRRGRLDRGDRPPRQDLRPGPRGGGRHGRAPRWRRSSDSWSSPP